MAIVETKDLYAGCNNVPLTLTLKINGVPANISSCDVRKMYFQYAGRRVGFARDAQFVTDGTDGKIMYLIQEADLTYEGWLDIQVYLQEAGGKFYTGTLKLSVGKPLNVAPVFGMLAVTLQDVSISTA